MSDKIRKKMLLFVLIAALALLSGCSIFISTPKTAKIHIQGLGNNGYEYIIALDAPACDPNLDIPITKKYTIQFDFEWLWESENSDHLYREIVDEEKAEPLTPWMLCKYRF